MPISEIGQAAIQKVLSDNPFLARSGIETGKTAEVAAEAAAKSFVERGRKTGPEIERAVAAIGARTL